MLARTVIRVEVMAKTIVTTGIAITDNAGTTPIPQMTISNVEALVVTDKTAVITITEAIRTSEEMIEATTKTEETETITDIIVTKEEMATETTTGSNGNEI